MQQKSFAEIIEKINKLYFKETFDLIVAIGQGGIIPASFIQKKLNVELQIIWLNFRNSNHQPKFKQPKLLMPLNFKTKDKKILLVDDVSRTGATLKLAKKKLHKANLIKTLIVNGTGNYELFNEDCFIFPWNKIDSLSSS
jgi:xanthine phosphoribosyltransferase